ncbi:MAG: translation elongation factor Ts [Burkholderiales bacterium]
MEISATQVKQLREATGLGMMECKQALKDAQGDLKAAEDLLRIKSGAKATKVAGRIAAEGAVTAHIAGKAGALLEVNCETDFVAKDENFAGFAKKICALVVERNPRDVAELSELSYSGADTVETARQNLIMKLGENIAVRRFQRLEATGRLAYYLHGQKIGVLVDYEGGETLGKELGMHISFYKPMCISDDQVPRDVIEKEKQIYTAQAAESGKPEAIVAKMVEGKIKKYLSEVTLLGQPFVKDTDQTVAQLLASKKAKVHAFVMFTVGEGIEKKSTDFAAEVKAQAALNR